MFRKTIRIALTGILLITHHILSAKSDTIFYEVDLKNRADHIIAITINLEPDYTGVMDFKIPVWTPGYYQILNFDENIHNMAAWSAHDQDKMDIIKLDRNTWRIPVRRNHPLIIQYQITAAKKFIALPFVDNNWCLLRPTGIFIFPMSLPHLRSKVTLTGIRDWKFVTGLSGKGNVFYAGNMDQLYDSPILAGNSLLVKTFWVRGIPHYVSGIDSGLPEKDAFYNDLQRIVESAVDLMREIPYDHYSFMSIGKGNGGIEQSNSTAFALDANAYADSASRQRTRNFLTHEYFHHFNVKRIRPIELGPFDYSRENRTNLLWVSEGLTVYFEDIILNRAGLKTGEQMLYDWATIIETYENNPGRKFQTLAESSFNTWEDGPFGVKGKTISYYEKGPIIGMLLDLKIRSTTNNKFSLIDVMRYLYQKYYKEEQRGFTESEFKKVCERIAGINLDEIFSFVYSTADIPYQRYFEAAGLSFLKADEDGKKKIKLVVSPNVSTTQKQILDDLFRIF